MTRIWCESSPKQNKRTSVQILDVHISAQHKRELHDALSDAERSFFKNATMGVRWCARECRFETLGTAAKLSQVFEKSTVLDLLDLQKTIKHLKETADAGVVCRPIQKAEMVFGHVADGSLFEKCEIHSHCGYLVFATWFGSWAALSNPSVWRIHLFTIMSVDFAQEWKCVILFKNSDFSHPWPCFFGSFEAFSGSRSIGPCRWFFIHFFGPSQDSVVM